MRERFISAWGIVGKVRLDWPDESEPSDTTAEQLMLAANSVAEQLDALRASPPTLDEPAASRLAELLDRASAVVVRLRSDGAEALHAPSDADRVRRDWSELQDIQRQVRDLTATPHA